jgi:hypothetical protein
MPQVFLGEAFSVPGNNEHATGAGVSQSCTSAGFFPPKKKNRLWSWRALDGIGQTGLFWSCYSSCGLKKDREFPNLGD